MTTPGTANQERMSATDTPPPLPQQHYLHYIQKRGKEDPLVETWVWTTFFFHLEVNDSDDDGSADDRYFEVEASTVSDECNCVRHCKVKAGVLMEKANSDAVGSLLW